MGLPAPYYEDAANGIRLFHGDCLDMLGEIEAGSVDAVVTDPPYGIDYEGHLRNAIDYGKIANDSIPFNPSHLLGYPFVILWGANNFADRLPIGGWICWDKRLSEDADRILGSPFELAWCSKRTMFKMIRVLHGGAKNADAPRGDVANQARYHPTQKPIRVMEACVRPVKSGTCVCDPYVGSGSTGLACLRTGRRFIGMEIEEKYCEIAARRLEREAKRFPLFEEPKATQRELMLD